MRKPAHIDEYEWSQMTEEEKQDVSDPLEQELFQASSPTPFTYNETEEQEPLDQPSQPGSTADLVKAESYDENEFTPRADTDLKAPVDAKSVISEITSFKANPDILKYQRQADKLAPTAYDALGEGASNLATTAGKTAISAAAARAGIDPSQSLKGWDVISEETKRRQALREKMRADLLARADKTRTEDIDRRKAMIEELKARKALQEKPQTDRVNIEIYEDGNKIIKSVPKNTPWLDQQVVAKFPVKPEFGNEEASPETINSANLQAQRVQGKNAQKLPPKATNAQVSAFLRAVGHPQSERQSTAGEQIAPKWMIDQINRVSGGKYQLPPTTTMAQIESMRTFLGQEYRQGGTLVEQDPNAWSYDKASKPAQTAYTDAIHSINKIIDKSMVDSKDMTLIQEAISTGKPMDVNAAQRIIAQKFNKGALSENDVLAFSGSQHVVDRFKRFVDKNLISGSNLNPEDQASLIAMTKYIIENEEAFKSNVIKHKAGIVEKQFPGVGKRLLSDYSVVDAPKFVDPNELKGSTTNKQQPPTGMKNRKTFKVIQPDKSIKVEALTEEEYEQKKAQKLIVK